MLCLPVTVATRSYMEAAPRKSEMLRTGAGASGGGPAAAASAAAADAEEEEEEEAAAAAGRLEVDDIAFGSCGARCAARGGAGGGRGEAEEGGTCERRRVSSRRSSAFSRRVPSSALRASGAQLSPRPALRGEHTRSAAGAVLAWTHERECGR